MLLSRAKLVKNARSAFPSASSSSAKEDSTPKLEDFIAQRDYAGAVTLLEFLKQSGQDDENTLPWLAYAAFHMGDYSKALETYRELIAAAPDANVQKVYHLYAAACLFYLGQYDEARGEAKRGPSKHRLRTRLLLHITARQPDEAAVKKYEERLLQSRGDVSGGDEQAAREAVQDQLSLAAHYVSQSEFTKASEIYVELLQARPDMTAIQVYLSLCYYKLDYNELSVDMLEPYLEAHGDSPVAANLKACNNWKLYDGRAAEEEVKGIVELMNTSSSTVNNDLIRHNLVVFREGADAFKVLPPLVDAIPEARVNLALWHLRRAEVLQALDLVENMPLTCPHDFIVKAVTLAAYGQADDSASHLKDAQRLFESVGQAPSEENTVAGRQCMASSFFLTGQFDKALMYLDSIKAYTFNDSAFCFNFGVALAACGRFAEAEEVLLQVQDMHMRQDPVFSSWLVRCLIMNGKPKQAWDIYVQSPHEEAFSLTTLIANECYRQGAFFYAAKAFDVLERLDPSPHHWEGKRGACAGAFQMIVAGKMKRERIRDIIALLSRNATTPQGDLMVRVMAKWAQENGVRLRHGM